MLFGFVNLHGCGGDCPNVEGEECKKACETCTKAVDEAEGDGDKGAAKEQCDKAYKDLEEDACKVSNNPEEAANQMAAAMTADTDGAAADGEDGN